MAPGQQLIPAPPADAAYAAGVRVATLRVWVYRGHISPLGADGCYDLEEILDWSDRRSQRHAVSARHQRHTRREGRCESQQVV